MVNRLEYAFRKKTIIEIHEYHDGNYGARGKKRMKKKKPTEEQMRLVNANNKARKCRHKLLEYYSPASVHGLIAWVTVLPIWQQLWMIFRKRSGK